MNEREEEAFRRAIDFASNEAVAADSDPHEYAKLLASTFCVSVGFVKARIDSCVNRIRAAEKDPTPMSVGTAIKLLENCGSEDDPIIFRGVNTTPRELGYAFSDLDESDRASGVRITYYDNDEDGMGIHVNGTLSGMVRRRVSWYTKNCGD